ncbi:MAG: hypothetical protein Q9219_002310 [cf. Caloplaca sp. 3 TL-2023]
MTTALPAFVADPSLPTNPSSPPPPTYPTNIPPPTTTTPTTALPDPEYSAATASTNPRTSYNSSSRLSSPSIPWGPFHPCFPHPNPHVPLSSPLAITTRIIRIPRDWMIAGDLAPQYSHTYPEILEPWVEEADFRMLVGRVNEGLLDAFRVDGWRAWGDALLGVATGWLWEDLGGEKVGVKRAVRGVERWIEEWNRGGGREGVGVRCVSLRRTGYLSVSFFSLRCPFTKANPSATKLDIQIPDPKVRVVEPEEEAAAAAAGTEEDPDQQQQPPGTATTTAPSTVKGEGA